MKQCPHVNKTYYCGALLNSGLAKEALYVPENWWEKYCVSGKYSTCPNLSTAQNMKYTQKRTTKGTTLRDDGKQKSYSGRETYSQDKQDIKRTTVKNKNQKKTNPVHATGGIEPHYCEKPWRSGGLRFRIVKSLFYLKPWK